MHIRAIQNVTRMKTSIDLQKFLEREGERDKERKKEVKRLKLGQRTKIKVT